MKRIKETANKTHWPRKAYKKIEARRRDLIIRISDWSRDKYEPAYDVETYIGGIYDWNESKVCSFSSKCGNKQRAKEEAIQFAQDKIKELL